jgi:hypothetical protein
MNTLRTILCGLCLLGAATVPSAAQIQPPTSQQLQQQHDQTIRNESSTVHNNLNQSIVQTPPQPQPYITPSGRAVTLPPGYIPMPNR